MSRIVIVISVLNTNDVFRIWVCTSIVLNHFCSSMAYGVHNSLLALNIRLLTKISLFWWIIFLVKLVTLYGGRSKLYAARKIIFPMEFDITTHHKLQLIGFNLIDQYI